MTQPLARAFCDGFGLRVPILLAPQMAPDAIQAWAAPLAAGPPVVASEISVYLPDFVAAMKACDIATWSGCLPWCQQLSPWSASLSLPQAIAFGSGFSFFVIPRDMCGRPLGCKHQIENSDDWVDCDHVRGGSAAWSSDKSKSHIACKASAIVASPRLSGSASSQAAYSPCNAVTVSTDRKSVCRERVYSSV